MTPQEVKLYTLLNSHQKEFREFLSEHGSDCVPTIVFDFSGFEILPWNEVKEFLPFDKPPYPANAEPGSFQIIFIENDFEHGMHVSSVTAKFQKGLLN